MISRNHVRKVLKRAMRHHGWDHISGNETMRFGPQDRGLGGEVEVDVKRLHRQVKHLSAPDLTAWLNRSVEQAVGDAKRTADVTPEEALDASRFVLKTLAFDEGITLPLPQAPAKLFKLVPVLFFGETMRSISSREFASWGIELSLLHEHALSNMLELPLPTSEIYDYGGRVLVGEIDLVPASAWLGALPQLAPKLGIHDQQVLACVPSEDRLHVLPADNLSQEGLDWFRRMNSHFHDEVLPFRLYEVTSSSWRSISADVGDPLPTEHHDREECPVDR